MNDTQVTTVFPRRKAFIRTLLLIVPNLIFFGWLFHAAHPWTVFLAIYGTGETTALLPAVFLVIAAGGVFFSTTRRAAFERVLNWAASARGTAWSFGALTVVASVIVGPSFLLNLLRAGWGAVVVFCALGMGLRLLESRLLGFNAKCFESPLERLVLATALGLGALSLLVFGAASAGLMNPWLWRAAALGGVVLNLNSIGDILAEGFEAAEKRALGLSSFALGAVLFVALFLLAHAPLIWSLPAEYDVLEYHLAAPAQYLRAGSVGFLKENIYAAFPENGEMLFLLPLLLSGGKVEGLPGAHVVLMAAWGLTILGVYAAARRLERSQNEKHDRANSPGPIIAALLFALVPLGAQLAADFYVEHFQTLFHLAAVLCGCAFISDFKIRQLFKLHALNNAHGWLLCAGLFAGLCCGAKYTGLIFTLAPLMVFIPIFCWLNGTEFDALFALCRVSLPAVIAFAPWAVRNGFAAGDPLYPLGVVMRRRVLGASGLPDRIDHFEAAVRAGETSWRSLGRALEQLMRGFRSPPPKTHDKFFLDIECGPQLCFFAAPGIASIVNAEAALVAFVFVADLVVWFLFSHRLNRFFYPHLTTLAVLGGLGFARVWRILPLRKVAAALCVAAVLVVAPLQLIWVTLYASIEGMAGRAPVIERAHAQFEDEPPTALTGVLPQSALPENARVLFIGEAQTFYCDRTPSYSVVFNVSLLEEALHQTHTADETLEYLRARGITHLHFNYPEWLRLDTSYALKLDDAGTRWNIVHWEDEPPLEQARKAMKTALYLDRNFTDYSDAWPAGVYPAYLKLSPAEYARLGELYEKHTRRVWPPRPPAWLWPERPAPWIWPDHPAPWTFFLPPTPWGGPDWPTPRIWPDKPGPLELRELF